MKLYKVDGKGEFEGITALVMETSKTRAVELLIKGSTIGPKDVKVTLIKHGDDRDGLVLMAHDAETGEVEFATEIKKKE